MLISFATTIHASQSNKTNKMSDRIQDLGMENLAFAEELYARFAILGEAGTWEGKSPLAALERPA